MQTVQIFCELYNPQLDNHPNQNPAPGKDIVEAICINWTVEENMQITIYTKNLFNIEEFD